MLNVHSRLQAWQQRIENVLDNVLPPATTSPTHLHEAVRYSVLNGGKRMRPLLVYATAEALGLALDEVDIPAAAIELIHVYSLVHDDLPAMDDDDLRRGKPTCHKAYNEATAILVGDGLQTLAFELLTTDFHSFSANPAQRLRMIGLLAKASGTQGMVGGQALDLAAVGKALTETQLENMHLHKTGALIRASVLLAAYAKADLPETYRMQLDRFAKSLGLAFQVQDDILDIVSDTSTLGKTQGADLAANKPTYPSIIGMPAAKTKLKDLYSDALQALECFGDSAQALREIAEFTVKRLR